MELVPHREYDKHDNRIWPDRPDWTTFFDTLLSFEDFKAKSKISGHSKNRSKGSNWVISLEANYSTCDSYSYHHYRGESETIDEAEAWRRAYEEYSDIWGHQGQVNLNGVFTEGCETWLADNGNKSGVTVDVVFSNYFHLWFYAVHYFCRDASGGGGVWMRRDRGLPSKDLCLFFGLLEGYETLLTRPDRVPSFKKIEKELAIHFDKIKMLDFPEGKQNIALPAFLPPRSAAGSGRAPGPPVLAAASLGGTAGGYFGGKGGAGVAQNIISQMPPHRVYGELFLGAGRVFRKKKGCEISIGLDSDEDVIYDWWPEAYQGSERPGWSISTGDAFNFLQTLRSEQKSFGGVTYDARDILIYLDPPYMDEVCSSPKRRYRHALRTPLEHANLLELIIKLPCMVMISHYDHPVYRQFLHDWRVVQFNTSTHFGIPRTETLFMNFAEPVKLHDPRFVGTDANERWNDTKMLKRKIKQFEEMTPRRRYKLLAGLTAYFDEKDANL